MKLSAGYKLSETGVIPEDWNIRPLLSATRIASGQVDPTISPYREMILVAPDHIESGSGRLIKKETAADQCAISGKYLFSKGDIVYSKIRPYLKKAILADFEGICSADMYPLKPGSDISGGFIFALILGHRFTKHAESVSVRSGMPKINRIELAEFSIALPPTKAEQEAIAEALSDADALIESLEQLLAKKRYIKQGAMQELLTGKKRLQGFSGKWREVTLGEVAKFYKGKGLSKSDLDPFGVEPCIHYGELFTRYAEIITKIESKVRTRPLNFFRSVINDVLMPTSDVTPYGLAKASCVFESGVILGGDILVIRAPLNSLLGSFLSYVIRSEREQVLQLVTGTTVFHLYSGNMKKFRFLAPPVEEQGAIIDVLNGLTAELAALEAKLTKARQIKQGMMAELLTGRIRLV